jgi:hypothetical protein
MNIDQYEDKQTNREPDNLSSYYILNIFRCLLKKRVCSIYTFREMGVQMKHLFLFIIFLSLLLSSFSISYSKSEWFNLDEDKHYATDFVLGAGQTKTVTITSNKRIWVGFKSNATCQQFQKYKEKNPIKLTQQKTGPSVSSVYGGATVFKPVDSKIVISVSNESQEDFKIVIYTKEFK